MAGESSKSSSEQVPSEDTTRTPDESGPAEDNDSEEHVKESLDAANELKQEATQSFRNENWTQALATYTMALDRLPKRIKVPEPLEGPPAPEAFTERTDDKKEQGSSEENRKSKPEPVVLTGLDLECAKLRAVLNANIGACHVKLEEYKEAVKACTEALADDPKYIKALQRRASCNEKIDSWSSLASAQDDYNTLLTLLPSDSPQIASTKRALAALKPHLEEAQKKETGEVLEKLKGIGNSLLGNFGLSTDNFKFEPNGQGGYSMNFVR